MSEAPEGFKLFHSVNDFLNAYHDYDGTVFVIGGAKIYDAFMPFVEKVYLTHVHRTIRDLYSGDEIDYTKLTKFPDSVYEIKWYLQISVDEICLDKRFGIVHYNFLTLLRR